MAEPLDSMIPLLAGFLAGAIAGDGRDVMKIAALEISPPDRCTVTFASGLQLAVTVTLIEEPRTRSDAP